MRILFGIILLFYLCFGVLYALKTPRWEAPDEPAHFNYVRVIAETGTLPILTAGDYDQAYLEKIKAEKFPPTDSVDSIRYESHQPPLYYFAAAPIYLFARSLGADVVLALRLFSVALGALLLVLAYQVFVRVFTTQKFLALAAVGLMATVPMHIAMTAAVNNDTFAEVMLACILLIAVRRAQGEMSDRHFVSLGGIVYGAVLLTKTTIYPSGLLLVLSEVAGYRLQVAGYDRTKPLWEKVDAKVWKRLAVLFGIALVISGAWFARNISIYGISDPFGLQRHDAVVIGQPTTAEWITRYGFKNIFADFFIITFKSFWAQFGWMGVLVNDRIYVGLFVLTATATFGGALWIIQLVRRRDDARVIWQWLLLGALLLTTVLAHVWYNLKFVQPQGRYLFPALIPLAALWTMGLYEIFEKRYVMIIFIVLYLVMLGLDYVALFWFIIPQLT